MITKEATTQIMKLLGQYLIDHADELMPIEYSDLYGDEIVIRLLRRRDNDNRCGQSPKRRQTRPEA